MKSQATTKGRTSPKGSRNAGAKTRDTARQRMLKTAGSTAPTAGDATPTAHKGRPKLPPGLGRTEVIRMRATPAEKEAYAARGGDAWLRTVLCPDTAAPV